ncbi:dihydrodipicolinate synthase family protein [Puniceibacterium sediminis]|uniref:Dihydrodipicolinate synthetase family protein n=1 Tax=Puniceibacterium sediminis TaxID=1608407 RepID=A0A238XDV5_9RHOB|nr:dihydrodipicolinate synthase family protein [Puniceibacterium sediminis]SNR56880.1 Dihydrodipicolinate synthetase family protein [Puniceibacterium sediminis]
MTHGEKIQLPEEVVHEVAGQVKVIVNAGCPARTQNHIDPETARVLAQHLNIAGIKDSGGSTETVSEYLRVAEEVGGSVVYCAPDHLVHWSLQQGCAGVISGLGNVAPQVLAAIMDGLNKGDTAVADVAQLVFAGLRKDLYALGFPPAMVKRALYMMDPSVGLSRQPALMPDAAQDAAILEKHSLT